MPLDIAKPYPKRARLLDKSNYIGQRGYFITINAYQRNNFFDKAQIVSSVTTYLKQASIIHNHDVIVYCFMPDHLHLVLAGKVESSNLLSFITYFKQISSYAFKQKFGVKLWATSFHDHVLRKEETIRSVGRYTLKNPIVAGLVEDVLDYPYAGSFVYELEELVESDPYIDLDSQA